MEIRLDAVLSNAKKQKLKRSQTNRPTTRNADYTYLKIHNGSFLFFVVMVNDAKINPQNILVHTTMHTKP